MPCVSSVMNAVTGLHFLGFKKLVSKLNDHERSVPPFFPNRTTDIVNLT